VSSLATLTYGACFRGNERLGVGQSGHSWTSGQKKTTGKMFRGSNCKEKYTGSLSKTVKKRETGKGFNFLRKDCRAEPDAVRGEETMPEKKERLWNEA